MVETKSQSKYKGGKMKMMKGGKMVMVKNKKKADFFAGGLKDPVMERKAAKEVHDGICKYAKGSLRTSMLRKTVGKRVTACGGRKKGKIAVCAYSYTNKRGKKVAVKKHCRKLRGQGQ